MTHIKRIHIYYLSALENLEPDPGCMLLFSDSAPARWRLYYRQKLPLSRSVAGNRSGYRALNCNLTKDEVIVAVKYHQPNRLLLAPESFEFLRSRIEKAHILYRVLGAVDPPVSGGRLST